MDASAQFPAALDLQVWFPWELRAAGVGAQQYTLRESFTFVSAVHGRITAPAGMVTDFASIPRPLWWWLDPEDPTILLPSVSHDYLYSVAGARADGPPLTREQADDVLVESMAACGASAWRQRVVYEAVRRFGASHWGTKG